jgi:hypothetical protein
MFVKEGWQIDEPEVRPDADMRTHAIGHLDHRSIIEVHGSRDLAERIYAFLKDIKDYQEDDPIHLEKEKIE